MGFCSNIFHGCNCAREEASTKLPDLVHKLWSIVITNPNSDMLICTIKMLISLTSSCPSGKLNFNFYKYFFNNKYIHLSRCYTDYDFY